MYFVILLGNAFRRLRNARSNAGESRRLFVHAAHSRTRRRGYSIIRGRKVTLLFASGGSACSILEFRARPSAASTHKEMLGYIFAAFDTLKLQHIDYQSHAWAHESIFTAAEMSRGSALIKECNYVHFMPRRRLFTRRHKSPRFNPRAFFPSVGDEVFAKYSRSLAAARPVPNVCARFSRA